METGGPPALRLPSRGALLASLPPGLGHLRERLWSRGLLLLLACLFVLSVVASPADYAVPPPPALLAAASIAVFAGFWLYAARDLERATGGPPSPRGRGRQSR